MSEKHIKPIERPKSLCDSAVENIRSAIVQGIYELGEPLSEAMLVKSLGISKTPIREALSILKVEGLVSVIPQKGTFVFTMSSNEVAQLGNYRNALESTALKMSLTSNAQILGDQLLNICEQMEEARKKGETRKYLELDGKFHSVMLNLCGNKFLQDGYKLVEGKIAALRTHLSAHPTHTEKSFHEHKQIAELIIEGRIDEANLILKKHITRGERSYADKVKDIAEADKLARANSRIKRA